MTESPYEFQPPTWQAQAACRPSVMPDVWQEFVDQPSELFFARRMGRQTPQWTAAIKSVCDSCPVRAECLDWGLRHEEFGWWGGVSARTLKIMRARDKISRAAPEVDPRTAQVIGTFFPPSHGTAARFKQHKRDGEVPCAACIEGNRLARSEDYKERYRIWQETATEEQRAQRRAENRERNRRRHRGYEW